MSFVLFVVIGSQSMKEKLRQLNKEIRQRVLDYGLDFFEVIFEVLSFEEMNMVAAYDGFPVRYPHWRFGMEYERLKRSYAYGLHRIYEMVINNDPCYAYLLDNNNLVDQKIVMAHVYAHSDFFKNNLWFAHTNRKMLNEMANHGTRVRRHIDRQGEAEVERFLDVCLSVADLIDPHSPAEEYTVEEEEEDKPIAVGRFKSKSYMDRYVNPPDYLEAERRRLEKEREQQKIPAEPQRDILLFLLRHAPLKSWQADILSIVREESYYFIPQRQTRIMNEGWATYWHSRTMTEGGILDPAEVIDYADHHSGTLGSRPGHVNPYKIGVELFRDIEERWNKGRFGKEYEECQDMTEKKNWDRKLALGRQKIFEVRRVYHDIGFIDAFLTKEFCLEQGLFVYKEVKGGSQSWYEITSRDYEQVKKALLFSLTNFGKPIIYVEDGNYRNRGELYLVHRHEGIDLDVAYAQDTLVNLCRLWGRPVHVETVIDERKIVYSYDGERHTEKEMF